MTTLTYTPKTQLGFRCELTVAEMTVLNVARDSDHQTPNVEGDDQFTSNDTLVDLVVGFATGENLFRRSRDDVEKKRLRKQADELRKDAEFLADLIPSLGEVGRPGWCSACFEHSPHRTVATGRWKGRAFVCQNCGAATKECSVTRCEHFAVRSSGRFVLKSCAEHSHAIPSFEQADERLADFTEVDDWLTPTRRNVGRSLVRAGAFVGTVAVTAPLAVAAAPAIGGLIGAWGTGLSGAAATSHGLALLGGGSVAAGGFGMAGGTAVVAAVGSSLLGAKGVAVASAYTSDDKSFHFEKVQDGDGPSVIFATGFLTESREPWEEWKPMITARFPGRCVYRLHWGSKELKDLGGFLGQGGGAAAAKAGIGKFAGKATKLAPKLLGPVSKANWVADLARNPWHVARRRAQMTGAALASIIGHVDEAPLILMGHSLGALVMATAADALGSGGLDPRLDEVHLLGAAIDADFRLNSLAAATNGTVFNYWSRRDKVLGKAYATAQLGHKAAGNTGFTARRAGVKNVDVSRQVPKHSEYIDHVKLRSS